MPNPIGRLQEMCTLKRWTPPKYETHTEEGEPHKKNFVMSCMVMGMTEIGEGSSKKMAKRKAAQKILKKLQSQAQEEFSKRFVDIYSDLKDLTLDSMTPNAEQEQEKFRRQMKELNSPAMQEVIRTCIHTPEVHGKLKEMLERVASENHFKLIPCPLDEKSITGEHMFLMEMTTNPILVCQGKGPTIEEAETEAIINALDFLKWMMK